MGGRAQDRAAQPAGYCRRLRSGGRLGAGRLGGGELRCTDGRALGAAGRLIEEGGLETLGRLIAEEGLDMLGRLVAGARDTSGRERGAEGITERDSGRLEEVRGGVTRGSTNREGVLSRGALVRGAR